jgi:uncharacterized protein YjeT (DUF2065 family)
MEEAIQKLAIICFFLTGLSHIFQPRVWVNLFIAIREKQETGAFINGFIHYPIGAIIVAFHNVWHGIPMILTLIGYGLLLKGLICFVFPKLALISLNRVSIDRSWEFVAAGIFAVALAGLFLYSLLTK